MFSKVIEYLERNVTANRLEMINEFKANEQSTKYSN